MNNGHGSRSLIEELRPGDHLCCIYETEEEHRAALTPLLRQGLERREKVLYIVDNHTTEAILDYLRADGVDVEPYLASGQLAMRTRDDTYVKDGNFDPDAMIALLQERTKQALTDGYTALRVTSEMTWSLRDPPGSERLIEYEAKANHLFPDNQCLAICQYDRRRFAPGLLLDVLRTHPLAMIDAEIHDNFYYIPPADFLGQEPQVAEMRHWIQNLNEHTRSEAEQARAEERLRESERVLKTARVGGWTIDLAHDIVTWTRTTKAIHEVANDYQPTLEQALEFFPGQSREALTQALQRAIEYGDAYDLELELVTAKKRHLWVHMIGRPEMEQGQYVRVSGTLQDITERKMAEEELRESEKIARALLNATTDSAFLMEPDGTFVALNEETARRLGKPVDELVGKCAYDFVSPDVAEHRKAQVERLVRSRKPLRFEDTRGDRIIDNSMYPVFDKQGKVTRLAIFGRDITKHVRMEETVRESERLFRQTFEAIPDPSILWKHEADGRIVLHMVNSAASKMSRGKIGDFLDATVEEFFQYTPDVVANIKRAFETEGTIRLELPYRLRTTGEAKWVMADYTKVSENYLLNTIRDITARVQAEQALRESEERFRKSFDTELVAIAISRRHDGMYLEANPGFVKVTGYPHDEIVGHTSRELSLFSSSQRQTLIDKLHKQGRLHNQELTFPTKSGELRTILFSIGPITIKDEECLLATMVDITKRKRMEQALRESNRRLEKTLGKLRKAQEQMMQRERLAAVGQLAAGIAHDFRNLLTPIVLHAEMSLYKPDLPPNLEQDLESILSESRKAAELVQQLLDFSSCSMIQIQPTDMKPLIEKIAAVLRRTIPENIRLFLDVSPTETPFIAAADPSRIEQALINLSLNARDAMPYGGELHIGLERIATKPGEASPMPETAHQVDMTREIPGARPEIQNPKPQTENRAWICLSISDTGTGMTEEVRAHLFEPFFTTKEVGEGPGLGLAQVYGIVRQHQCHIDIETEVGKGTTFRIYLPAFVERDATEKRYSSVGERDADTLQGQGETILLVEDNDQVREAGRSILESLGYRTLTAANGREALSIYEAEGGVDLIITDMVMPEMGGKQLMQRLRRMDANLQALGLTGYTIEEVAREVRELGFVDMIHKPFTLEVLMRAIRRALDQGSS